MMESIKETLEITKLIAKQVTTNHVFIKGSPQFKNNIADHVMNCDYCYALLEGILSCTMAHMKAQEMRERIMVVKLKGGDTA